MLIKKYPNRRLYNTSSRTYVNLNDLAALIRKGEEVQVVDAKTGEDITRVVPQIQHRRRQPASG